MRSWVCWPGLVLVRFSSGQAALLSEPTPAGWQDVCPRRVLPRGIEAPANQLVYSSQGYGWTMKHGRDLVGSGWSPRGNPDRTTSF